MRRRHNASAAPVIEWRPAKPRIHHHLSLYRDCYDRKRMAFLGVVPFVAHRSRLSSFRFTSFGRAPNSVVPQYSVNRDRACRHLSLRNKDNDDRGLLCPVCQCPHLWGVCFLSRSSCYYYLADLNLCPREEFRILSRRVFRLCARVLPDSALFQVQSFDASSWKRADVVVISCLFGCTVIERVQGEIWIAALCGTLDHSCSYVCIEI